MPRSRLSWAPRVEPVILFVQHLAAARLRILAEQIRFAAEVADRANHPAKATPRQLKRLRKSPKQ
jgi:hypothetical protein